MSETHNQKYIELYLDSGIRIFITPLNRHHIGAITEAANERYPLPDEKAFEEVIQEGAIPGGVGTPAKENPEYLALLKEAQENRRAFQLNAMIDIGVHFPDFESRERVITHFAAERETMRKHIELPTDAWEATWKYCILRTNEDEAAVTLALMNQLPLTEGEIVNEIRLFRRLVSK